MRPYLLAVASSAAIHAAAVAWLVLRTPGPTAVPHRQPAEPVEITVEPRALPPAAEPATMDVVLLPPAADEPVYDAPPDRPAIATARPAIAAAQPPGTGSAGPAAQAAISTSHGVATAPAPSEPSAPAHSNLMTMRHGPAPQLTLPNGRWDDLDHAPAGSSPTPDATGNLKPSGGGSYRMDEGVFVADIKSDGSTHITDSPNLQVHVALPSAKDIGHGLANWFTADKGKFGETDDPGVGNSIQVSSGATATVQDPVSNHNADRATTVVVPVIGGSFDVNDWLMRRGGADPYASRKLALLDATRDARAQIGARHRDDQLRRVDELVQRNLDALWAAVPDVKSRKQALFELWDECAETGDAATVEAAEAARRLVIGFIRAKLPAGSPGAFSEAELAELARTKHSHAAFKPYD